MTCFVYRSYIIVENDQSKQLALRQSFMEFLFARSQYSVDLTLISTLN